MKRLSKKILALLLSVTIIISTMLPAAITVEADVPIGAAASGLLTAGVKHIPFVGDLVSASFAPLFNKAFGVPSTKNLQKDLKEIKKKLDEISAKIDALSVKIDETHKETLEKIYNTELNSFNDSMINVKNGTETVYKNISQIISSVENIEGLDDDTAEKLQILKTACIVSSKTFQYSKYTADIDFVQTYISGTDLKEGDNALTRIYKAYCSDAMLGGEAALMANKTVSAISNCMQDAYVANDIVMFACQYVNLHYKEYAELVKNDSLFAPYAGKLNDFANDADFSSELLKIKEGSILLFGEEILEDDDKKNLQIGDPIEGGAVGEYNDMVSDAWCWYIKDTNYAKNSAVITYVKLDKEINFLIASDYGTPCGWNDTSSKTQTGSIESHARYSAALRTAPNRALTREDLKKLFEHIQNSEYFGTGDTNRVTLQEALENFGFSFANFNSYTAKKPLPDNTVQAFLTKVDCKVEKHYDSITAYGPRLSDNVIEAYNNFDMKHYADINYTNGKADYLRIQLGGDTTKDFVTFYFTAAETINSESEFIDFYKKVANGDNYRNKTVRITKDLDLSKYNLLTLWPDSKKENRFCGVFDGDGHTIKNVDMSNGTEWLGLFRSMGIDGEVKNLTITDSKFGNGKGVAVGGVVGQATGDNSVIDNVTVTNCVIKGTDYVGGIVGTSSLKEADYCDDMYSMIRIRNCVSNSTITGTGKTGGIEGGGGSVRIEKCTNKSTVTSDGNVGGIYGEGLNRDEDPQVVVRECTNVGNITSKASNAGGIVGRIYSDASSHYIFKNKNSGKINAKNSASGIVAVNYGGGVIDSNKNSGAVTSEADYVAGIIAWNQDDKTQIINNENSGKIYGPKQAGGISGYVGDSDSKPYYKFENNKNSGDVESTNSDAGGICGGLESDGPKNQLIDVNYNENTGNIKAKRQAGGIVGWNEGECQFIKNINSGDITADDAAGGVCGRTEDDPNKFENSKVTGTIKGTNYSGKICGWDNYKKKTINSDATLFGFFGSIFGSGNVMIVIAMLTLIIIAGAVIIIVNKKKNSNS